MSSDETARPVPVEPGPRPDPPEFDPDPRLIGHLEGNVRERNRYRRQAERAREEANQGGD